MSWTLLRVVAMYWSTSASPPRIFSVAETCVNVGVRLGPGVADVEEGGAGHRVLAVVGEGVADHLDEGQRLEDARFLDHGLDHALQDDVVGELRGLGECKGHLGSSSI